MNVLITGAQGMLGQDLQPALAKQHKVVATDIQELDITNREAVFTLIGAIRPNLVVHCAAFTDVDRSESKSDLAFLVNDAGTGNIALACRHHQVKLVYISTDFVFDGKETAPYSEDAPVNPLNRYGLSKLAGELAVRTLLEHYLIVRTSWLFGANGRNFVTAILEQAFKKPELRVVADQHGCPTSTVDLADAIVRLIAVNAEGMVHVSCPPVTTWFEFAQAIVREAGFTNVTVTPMTSAELNRAAQRPQYSALDGSRYKQLTGHDLRSWLAALREFFRHEHKRLDRQ